MGRKERLLADQVRILYDRCIFGLTATLINGCILAYVLWDRVDTSHLKLWLAGVICLVLLRLAVYLSYQRAATPDREPARWKNIFNVSLFLAGLLWGMPAVLLFPHSSIGHQAFIAFVTGGMVAGAVAAFTSLLSAYFVFSIPALLPLTLRFFLIGGDIHVAMGTMLVIFFLLVSLTAVRTHRDFVRLLALRDEKSQLILELQQEIGQRQQAEKSLQKRTHQIEEIVGSRTAELKEVVKQLREEVKTRKTMALALKENQQRMRAVLNYAPLIIWAIDQEGIFTFAEGKALEKIGLQPGQLVGKSLFSLFKDDEQILKDAKKVLAGSLVSGPTQFRDLIYESRIEPLRDDGDTVIGAIGVAIDITTQQKAKEAARLGEEKYRDLVENINDVLFTTDRKGRITYISPVVKSVLGYLPEEVKSMRLCNLIEAVGRMNMESDFKQALANQTTINEHKFINKSGQLTWCRASIRPITEGDGVKGVQGIISDITQSKHLEEQLQRAHKMEAVGSLAGGVAHDLNNILSGIVSYPDLLLIDLPKDSPLRKPITTIKASGEKAAAIVQDLLTLARQGVASTELLNINRIIEEYLVSSEFKSLRELYPEVQVIGNLQPDLLNMMGSRVHLSNTLMNLIFNAIENIPSSREGTITITTANHYADTSTAGFETVQEGEYVVLSVKDTGTGIAEEDLARIFEPFYTRKVMGRSGSGLGMAVVWGTVKDHHGYINVTNHKEMGTSFELYFPASRQTMAESADPVPISNYLGHGELILVIDDVQSQREIASGMLDRLGYQAEAVASGEEAIDYLSEKRPDLIILDMIMSPGIDGFETYKRIKKINPDQRAIIVSGYSETDRVHNTQRLGAGQYLKKPYTLEAIGLAIRKELERKK